MVNLSVSPVFTLQVFLKKTKVSRMKRNQRVGACNVLTYDIIRNPTDADGCRRMPTDCRRIADGLPTDCRRIADGLPTDCRRIAEGLLKDCRRMPTDADGHRRTPTDTDGRKPTDGSVM